MTIDINIGFDMDEVLADLLEQLISFHNHEYGTNLTKDDFRSYSVAETVGCTVEESTERLRKFFNSDHFRDIKPIPGSQEGVGLIVDRYGKQPIITARAYLITKETKDWAHSFYPNTFSSINLTNQWHGDSTKRRKSQVCQELDIDIIIDDSPKHAYDCANAGTDTLLFGDYPWNKNTDPHPRIERVPSMTAAFGWIKENEGRYQK